MFNADIASDLFEAGKDEEGFPVIGEVYYVVIENSKGRRFRHFQNFKGINVKWEEGEVIVSDLRNEAISNALDLVRRVNSALATGLKLDAERWNEIEPAYGSQEYISQGIEEQRCHAERMEAMDS